MILEAINRDEQSVVFKALLSDVRNFIMAELQRTGQLDDMSVTLQEDAAVFFAQRNDLSDDESKETLQKIINVLKNQDFIGAANNSMMMNQLQN